jgi:hypothetical protein
VEVTNGLVEVIGEIVPDGNEPEAHNAPPQAQQGRQNGQQGAHRHGIGSRCRTGGRRQQRQVGHCRCEAHLEQGLGAPEVARLANAELRQPSDTVLHHLTPPSSFIECRTGLQLARLLEQHFVWVDLDRPTALTARALGPQGARCTGLDGKYEGATSTFSRSKITRFVVVGAGACAGFQIDLKRGS